MSRLNWENTNLAIILSEKYLSNKFDQLAHFKI